MATVVKTLVGTAGNLLTTELDALADNTGAVSTVANGATGIFNNVSGGGGTPNLDGYRECQLELLLKAGAGNWGANAAIGMWFLRSLDGTNFENQTSGVKPFREPDVTFWPRPQTSGDQRIKGLWGPSGSRVCDGKLPPGQWKVYVYGSGLGQAWAASSNVLRIQASTPTDV